MIQSKKNYLEEATDTVLRYNIGDIINKISYMNGIELSYYSNINDIYEKLFHNTKFLLDSSETLPYPDKLLDQIKLELENLYDTTNNVKSKLESILLECFPTAFEYVGGEINIEIKEPQDINLNNDIFNLDSIYDYIWEIYLLNIRNNLYLSVLNIKLYDEDKFISINNSIEHYLSSVNREFKESSFVDKIYLILDIISGLQIERVGLFDQVCEFFQITNKDECTGGIRTPNLI